MKSCCALNLVGLGNQTHKKSQIGPIKNVYHSKETYEGKNEIYILEWLYAGTYFQIDHFFNELKETDEYVFI